MTQQNNDIIVKLFIKGLGEKVNSWSVEVIQHGVKSFHRSKCVWGDTRVHSDMLQLALKSDTIEQ